MRSSFCSGVTRAKTRSFAKARRSSSDNWASDRSPVPAVTVPRASVRPTAREMLSAVLGPRAALGPVARAVLVPSRRSASIERMARRSVQKPIAVLIASTTATAADCCSSPKNAASSMAAASSPTTGLASWRTKMTRLEAGGRVRSRFGPKRLARLLASAVVSPAPGSTASAAASAAAVRT